MESSVSNDPPDARKHVNSVLRWLSVVGGVGLGFVLLSLLGAGTANADSTDGHTSRSQGGSAHHTDGLLDGLTDQLSDDVVAPATKLVDQLANTTQEVAGKADLPVQSVLAPVAKTVQAVTSTVDHAVGGVTHQVVKPVVGAVTTTVSEVTEPVTDRLGGITDPVLEPVVGTSAGTPKVDVPATKAKHASKHGAAAAKPSQAPPPVAFRAVVPDRATVSSDTGRQSAATGPAHSPSGPGLPLAPSAPEGAPGSTTQTTSSGTGGGSALGVLTGQSSLVGASPSWRAPPAVVLAPTWCDFYGHNHPS